MSLQKRVCLGIRKSQDKLLGSESGGKLLRPNYLRILGANRLLVDVGWEALILYVHLLQLVWVRGCAWRHDKLHQKLPRERLGSKNHVDARGISPLHIKGRLRLHASTSVRSSFPHALLTVWRGWYV
eukprot:749478-Hanusia_phi.AAC.1